MPSLGKIKSVITNATEISSFVREVSKTNTFQDFNFNTFSVQTTNNRIKDFIYLKRSMKRVGRGRGRGCGGGRVMGRGGDGDRVYPVGVKRGVRVTI